MKDGNGSSEGGLGNGELRQELELTADQRARLQLVNDRLEGDGEVNPNLADTPERLAEHGFKWLNGRPHGIR